MSVNICLPESGRTVRLGDECERDGLVPAGLLSRFKFPGCLLRPSVISSFSEPVTSYTCPQTLELYIATNTLLDLRTWGCLPKRRETSLSGLTVNAYNLEVRLRLVRSCS